jgi:hypothetical protein
MIHHEISAALARERVSTYLAETEAARRAKQARQGRPLAAGWLVSFGRRLSQARRPRRLIYGCSSFRTQREPGSTPWTAHPWPPSSNDTAAT